MRSPEAIKGIREACLIARRILDAAHAAVRPGVTTEEIDRVVGMSTLRDKSTSEIRACGGLKSLAQDV